MSSAAVRGRIGPLKLTRVKDMDVLTEVAVEPSRLSPGDRAAQKGPTTCAQILTELMQGMDLKPPDRVIVVEPLPRAHGDWPRATWSLQKSREPSKKPLVTYIGTSTEPKTTERLNGILQGILMREWWENQPEAGPATPTACNTAAIPKPKLRCCAWQDNQAIVPDSAMAKFEGSSYESFWNKLVEQHNEKFNQKAAGDNSVADNTAATGPDFSFKPPATTTGVVPLAETPLDSLN
eukprot:8932048-Lingulodinium_polyedra.AAC.1